MPAATAILPADWIGQIALKLGDAVGWPITWSEGAGPSDSAAVEPGVIPVDDGLRVIGRLIVESPDDRHLLPAFEAACEVTEVFAGVLSRLAASEEKWRSQNRTAATVGQIAATQTEGDVFRSTLSALLQAAVKTSGLWSAAFYLLDPVSSRLRLRATHNLPAASVPARCAEQRNAVSFSRQRAEDHAYLPHGFAVGLAVPVCWQSEVIGSLWCFDRRDRSLGSGEIQTLSSVAAQIASVLERTVLLEESVQRRQLKSDLKFASRSLPVGQIQAFPDDCRLDVSARTATVIEVGGDLCDVIPLGNQRTLIAIGDAVGHGIPAAMLASVTRGALRALVARSSPDELTTPSLMNCVNRALQTITRSEQFVTMTLGILDARSATLTYTNAGHPPPLLLRDGTWQSLSSHGLFLGISPEVNYPATEIPLQTGDVLVCFTDGVTETTSRARQVFRRQGIRDTIPAAEDATAEAIAETIWQRLQAHDPGRPLRDDRTLLVLRFLEERSAAEHFL